MTTQGNELGEGAGIHAINSTTKEVVWSHDSFYRKYYDVDPIGDDKILFSVMANRWPWNGGDGYPWKAVVINWRTGELTDSFSVPPDTHDVDYIGDDKYLISNKGIHSRNLNAWKNESYRQGWFERTDRQLWHQIYVYNRSSDQVTWQYNFTDHYPETAGDGLGNHQDFTHLNDVDLVKNGSAILASPREFDRVILINRSTKETEWELGKEDEYTTLHEQHNPVLLSTNPPTVLVADSENDRIIEYQRNGTEWNTTWVYHGNLVWPRDADRLPNGNTLIVDTGGRRVIEVTPSGDVIWEYDTGLAPYDVERLQFGDEPAGPAMDNVTQPSNKQAPGVVMIWQEYYALAAWILPPWITSVNFVLVNIGGLAVVLWGGFEFLLWRS